MFEPTIINVLCLGVLSILSCGAFVLFLLRSSNEKNASEAYSQRDRGINPMTRQH